MAQLRAFEAVQRAAMMRAQRQFDASVLGLGARSPAELEAAARAREAATYSDDESAALRRQRIELAGAMARLSAEHQLAEAQKERMRAYEEAITGQKLELDLIGKTTGEAERLRTEFQLMQQLREEAARNNIPMDEREIELIRQKAEEYGRYADAIARANLRNELQFERDQLFRSSTDQQIASRLRSAGLRVDFTSQEASAIRQNIQLQELRDGVQGFWSDMRQGLRNGEDIGEAFGSAILNGLTRRAEKWSEQILDTLISSIAKSMGIGGTIAQPDMGSYALHGVARLFSPANSNADLSIYRNAIASIESLGSGGYSAIGPTHPTLGRALGRYQIMEANIGPWSQSALGRSISATEFLQNSSLQDSIFDHRFGGYLSKYGAQGAASMWFTGRPSAPNAMDSLGTTGAAYLEKFNAALDNASAGLGDFGGGLSTFAKTLASSASGTANWFTKLASSFGGSSGALGFMNSISPLATRAILGGAVGLFARGGISDRPAIFGEAGPEAAVPLPDGRRIPVDLRMSAAQGEQPIRIELVSRFLADGGFESAVERSSRPVAVQEAGRAASQVARAIPSMALGAMDANRTRRTRVVSPAGAA